MCIISRHCFNCSLSSVNQETLAARNYLRGKYLLTDSNYFFILILFECFCFKLKSVIYHLEICLS